MGHTKECVTAERPKNALTIPYLLYAYDVPRSSFRRRVGSDKKGVTIDGYDGRHQKKAKDFISVNESRTAAATMYTPRHMFVTEHLMCGGPLSYGQKHTGRLKELALRFDALVGSGAYVSHWDRLLKEHDSKWPFIRQELIDALEAQVCRSYKQLSTYVNGWCSARTIERWLNSHPSFEVYRKNVKPGLTEVMCLYYCFHAIIHLSLMFLSFSLHRSIKENKWSSANALWSFAGG